MNYYLDGDFDIYGLKGDIYTSVYSQGNGEPIELKSSVHNGVNKKTFSDLIQFYNKHKKHFDDVKKMLGIDIWFLEHFRLYFSYRNFYLKVACIKQFLEKYEEGRVLTCDMRLQNFLPTEKLHYKNKPNKQPIVKRKYLRLIRELFFMLNFFNPLRRRHYKGHFVCVNIWDCIKGYTRLGALEKDLTQIIVRSNFILSESLPSKRAIPKKEITSDNIFSDYIFRFSFILDVIRMKKTLKELRKNISILDGEEKVVFDLFLSQKFSFYMYYLRFKAFDRFFERQGVLSVVISDENSPQNKVIQYAAHKHGVKVYAVQHGNIHELHPAYIYREYNEKPLLPDITFTWGNYFTELLIQQGGYKENEVFTSGRIALLKEKRFLNPAINKKEKIVLYATQPQRDPFIRMKQLQDVLHVAKELKGNFKLVVRPHPREKTNETYNQAATEVDFFDFIIDRDSDLKSHLEVCDFLIVSFSTVGTEFIPYYKPLIVLDYMTQDLAGWIKEGVGVPVRNRKELLNYLDSPDLDINKEAYDRFIKNYFYKVDDRAAERIKHVIYGAI